MSDHQPLNIYLRYEYITTRQVGDLLTSLSTLYNGLRFASLPDLREVPPNRANELRVDSVRTGDSIIIEVIEGIDQIVKSLDPTLATTIAATPPLAALWGLLYRLVDKTEALVNRGLTNRIERGQASADLVSRRQELELRKREIEHRTQEMAREEYIRALHDAAALAQGQIPQVTPPRDQVSYYSTMASEAAPALDQLIAIVLAANVLEMRIPPPAEESDPGHS